MYPIHYFNLSNHVENQLLFIFRKKHWIGIISIFLYFHKFISRTLPLILFLFKYKSSANPAKWKLHGDFA